MNEESGWKLLLKAVWFFTWLTMSIWAGMLLVCWLVIWLIGVIDPAPHL